MNETTLLLMLAYVILELYEISWQRANSMMGMLSRMHRFYRKSALLFFIMHPTYPFIMYLILFYGIKTAFIMMFLLKTIDIIVKVLLMQQVFEKHQLSNEMSAMLLAPIHPLMPFIGLLIYPPFIYMALYM